MLIIFCRKSYNSNELNMLWLIVILMVIKLSRQKTTTLIFKNNVMVIVFLYMIDFYTKSTLIPFLNQR